MRGKYFKGQNLWYNLTQLFVLIPFIAFLLLRVFDVPLTEDELWGYIFYIIGIVFMLTAGQMFVKQRHQEAVNEVEVFLNGKVRRSGIKSKKMLLGFEILDEIDVDFGDLSEFEKTRRYQIAKQKIIKSIAVEDFHGKRKLHIKQKGKLKELLGWDKTLTEMKKEEREREKNREIEKKIDLPYEHVDLKEAEIDIDDLLENHRFFFGLLYEEESFESDDDEDKDGIAFDRAFVILRKSEDGKDLLKPHRRNAYDKDNYRISIPVVDTYSLVIDWVLDTIPILYIKFTENMIHEDVTEILRAEDIKYIQNLVTRHLLNQLIGENKQPDYKIDRLEAERDSVEKEYYLLISDLIKRRVRGMGMSDNIEIERLNKELRKQTRRRYIAYTLFGILVAVSALFGFIAFGLPFLGGL